MHPSFALSKLKPFVANGKSLNAIKTNILAHSISLYSSVGFEALNNDEMESGWLTVSMRMAIINFIGIYLWAQDMGREKITALFNRG